MQHVTRWIVTLTLTTLSLASTSGLAATFPVVQDTNSNAIKAYANYSHREKVIVRGWDSSRGFVQFDLDNGSDASLAEVATLQIHVAEVKASGVLTLHRVLQAWDESTLNAVNEPEYVSTPFATISIDVTDEGEPVFVDITAAVRNWVAGNSNYGVAIVARSSANVNLGALNGNQPMVIETESNVPQCVVGTLYDPYRKFCATVSDISHSFVPDSETELAEAGLELDEPVPVPGGIGAGTVYQPGTHQALRHAVFYTKMFVQPDGVGSETSNWWLLTPATNHTDSATEFSGLYASHLEEGWFGIFARPCTPEYPCPDGKTVNGWQTGWNHPITNFACNVSEFVDQGGHDQKVMQYANETVMLDDQTPPLWRNAIYLWNKCSAEWDLIWRHEYREIKRDCSVDGCYRWGPILETVGTQGEINELGYEGSILFHDGTWSTLPGDMTSFRWPVSPWLLSHVEPNGGFGVGSRFSSNQPPAILSTTSDSFVDRQSPSSVFGMRDKIRIATWAPKIGFAHFDLRNLVGFTSAELNLFIEDVINSGRINVHVVYEDWDEGTLSYNSMPAYDSAPIVSFDVSAADAGRTVTVDLAPLVRRWLDGSLTNYGIALVPEVRLNVIVTSKEARNDHSLVIRIDD